MVDYIEDLFHFLFDFALFGLGLIFLLKSISVMHLMMATFQQLTSGGF